MSVNRLALVLALSLTGCGPDNSKDQSANAEAEIRTLLDNWSDAFRRKDLNGVMAIYAPGSEVTAFDIVPPLAYRGADSYRKDYAEFFAAFKGPLQVEMRDLKVVAGRDVAFAYGVERLRGTLVDGSTFDTWVRATQGYRRVNGRWLAVHDHISVPVDLESGKARLDLQP